MGFDDRYGIYGVGAQMNADLIQRYRDGVPDSVIVYNSPRYESDGTFDVNMDLGVYAQDSWTINRLTVNPGLRLYVLKGSIAPWRRTGRPVRAGASLERVSRHHGLHRRRTALRGDV